MQEDISITNEQSQEPQVIFGLPFEEYLKIDAISNSQITQRIKYPHGYLKINDTKSTNFGRAFHSLILEPDLFFKTYYLRRRKDGRTSAYKKETEKMIGSGKICLDVEDWKNLSLMRKVFKNSKIMQTIFNKKNVYKEVTVIFYYLGKKCKMRIDCLVNPSSKSVFMLDLKTTQSLDPWMIRKSIQDYGYARQAAFYSLGAKLAFKSNEAIFVNAFFETPTPSKMAIGCYLTALGEYTLAQAENEITVVIQNWDNEQKTIEMEI